MKILFAIAFAVLTLANSGCQTSRALKQPIPVSRAIGIQDERTERIGKVIQETMRKENIPGISVAIVDHGKIIWAQGFGWRDIHRKLPVDTDTQFQTGSISKPVTALGVLVLNADGKVDLDKDVNNYLRDWQLQNPFTNSPVTLRELLCHRAGIVPHGFAGYNERKTPPSLMEILKRDNFLTGWLTANYFGPIKVTKPPGSAYSYSGGGYCVAQKTVEDVTGESFEDAMNELVLQPLEMNRSNFQQPPQDTNDIAIGYGWMKTISGGGRWRVYPEKAMGGLWTTPQDLARLIIAVQDASAGKNSGTISPAIAQEYLKPQFDSWQGIGIRVSGAGENRGFYHAGENFGYFAKFGAGVSDGRGWVIMCNANKNKFGSILQSIGKEFNWN
jgi:CubicO group peptidase (beta-lactamase class C family)